MKQADICEKMEMTREQQRKLKELKSSLMKTVHPYIKRYGWKKKDFMIWFIRDELFFSLLLSVEEKDGQCFLAGRGTVKPLWSDEILWEILGMEENKEEPLSLRSIGAFTIYGAEIYKSNDELPEWESFELKAAVEKVTADFQSVVQKMNIDDFYCFAKETIYQRELLKCIILIYQGSCEDAAAVAAAMDSDYFSNEGQGFRKRALEYMKEKSVQRS